MLFAVGNWTGQWAPGCGGGGGGGAIAFRAGNLMRVTVDGRVQAQGGSGVVDSSPVASSGVPAPSGAGAGGSVLLQTGDRSEITGLIDVRGGTGGTVTRIPTNLGFANENIQVAGGNGGPGVLRLEVPRDPLVSLLPNVQPPATAANVAVLGDRDPIVGFQSKFYSTGQSFGPEYVRYEIDAVINNVHVIFSDDPTVGQPARFGSAPIQARWQAGFIDPFTGAVDPNTLRPWHEFVGPGGGGPSLNDDALNGFRFIIQLDTTSGQTIEIDSVRVVFRYC
jgi:hypothetical protein